MKSFDGLAKEFGRHGYCSAIARVIVNKGKRTFVRCWKPLALHREGEGRTLRMWLECPEHKQKWQGA